MSANARVKDLTKHRTVQPSIARWRSDLGGSSNCEHAVGRVRINRPSLCFFFMIVQAVAP